MSQQLRALHSEFSHAFFSLVPLPKIKHFQYSNYPQCSNYLKSEEQTLNMFIFQLRQDKNLSLKYTEMKPTYPNENNINTKK